MSRTHDSIDVRLISKVSSLYYNQNNSQQEIADRLHLSRPKVSRLLKQARKQGIVQINVITSNGNYTDLENALEEKYGLKEVLISGNDESETELSRKSINRQIGSAAANYFYRTVNPGDTVGVSWGTTLQAMVDAMRPQKIEDLHIVQTLGGVGPPEAKAHATDISRRLSQLFHCRLSLLPAPGIVGSIQAKKVLISDYQVKMTLDLFSKINTLYVGLGAINTNPVLDKNSLWQTADIYNDIINSEAVGDIALHFFDIDGHEVDSDLKNLIIGVSIDEIKQIDTVVGMAGGREKVDAIRGALNGKLINVLITDYQTARLIISEA